MTQHLRESRGNVIHATDYTSLHFLWSLSPGVGNRRMMQGEDAQWMGLATMGDEVSCEKLRYDLTHENNYHECLIP